MNNYKNLSWEEIGERFAQTEQLIRETDQLIKKNAKAAAKAAAKERKETAKERKEAAKERKEADLKYEKMRAESDARIEKMKAEDDRKRAETDERLDALGKLIGGIAHSNGDMAEEYFYNSLKKDKFFVHEKFDKISRNLTYRGVDYNLKMECDILLFNGKSAAIIEVKYNAKPENISVEKLISRVAIFKILYPEYKNHNIYLGVAAMSFKKSLIKELHQAGIATIHQIGKKMVIYDKEVKVF